MSQKIGSNHHISAEMLDDSAAVRTAIPSIVADQVRSLIVEAQKTGESIDWSSFRINVEHDELWPNTYILQARMETKS